MEYGGIFAQIKTLNDNGEYSTIKYTDILPFALFGRTPVSAFLKSYPD